MSESPSDEQLRPLLTKARKCNSGYRSHERATALFDPETGELLAGPVTLEQGHVEWGDGIEIRASGSNTTLDDLRDAFEYKQRLWQAHRRDREGDSA